MFNTRRSLCRAGMLSVVVCVVGACGGPASLPDTPDLRLEKARELVRMEIEGGALDETLDLGADLAFAASVDALEAELDRELTTDEEVRVRRVMRDALAEIVTEPAWSEAVAEVYARHFTPAEMQAAIEFYSSPTGMRVLALQGTLHSEVGDATEAILEAQLETYIDTVDAGIAAEFPEVVEP